MKLNIAIQVTKDRIHCDKNCGWLKEAESGFMDSGSHGLTCALFDVSLIDERCEECLMATGDDW